MIVEMAMAGKYEKYFWPIVILKSLKPPWKKQLLCTYLSFQTAVCYCFSTELYKCQKITVWSGENELSNIQSHKFAASRSDQLLRAI